MHAESVLAEVDKTRVSGIRIHPQITALHPSASARAGVDSAHGSALYSGQLAPATANAIAPLRPVLIHPEVVDDTKWIRGFEFGWVDMEKQYGFAYLWLKLGGIWINTDLVKEGELISTKDLLNPKWKGKMIFGDPRTCGGAFYPATAMPLNLVWRRI